MISSKFTEKVTTRVSQIELTSMDPVKSLGWCCRDVRVQLNNTLNLVTYLQVQLLELMDENQQLKAQLETCSEVKSPVKLKDAAELPDPSDINAHVKAEPPGPMAEPCTSDPCAVPVALAAPGESTSQPPVNGDHPMGDPVADRDVQQPLPMDHIKVSDVRSIPLKQKLSQPKVLDVRRDLKLPHTPMMGGNFQCDKCPMSFPTAEFLSFHMPTHTGKRRGYHICPVCDAMFVAKSDLSKHLAVHPDIKQYVCPVCNKSYTSKNNYKLHVKVHTGEGLYPCSYCGKSFHTENHLNVHLRTHTGERPYECAYCQKSFTQKSGLVNHTRLHTGEKPFMCPLCPKAFTQKSNLNFHLSKHHPPQNSYHLNDNTFPAENHAFAAVDNSKFTSSESKFPPNGNQFTVSEN